ncbi:hypothetical protein [Xanthobacter sp. KR7-225]|uniref:hypothetical protein n=1 Tax=Xanthobacter sp. KR7-225 TaxID=3156613 RepID=UPI0032B37973
MLRRLVASATSGGTGGAMRVTSRSGAVVAEVAVARTGGASAEDVARGRGVSLMTVRSQIRAILGKSEAENLRDFERTMATLGALVPPMR